MNIASMSGAELDELGAQDQIRKRNFKFQTMAQMVSEVEEFGKQPLIKGVMNWGETSAWIAPPGKMKSALLASAAVSVAAGVDWHGRKVKQRAGVVYFALERADLVRRRLVAQATRMGVDPASLNILLVTEVIDLLNPASVPRVSSIINDASHFYTGPLNPGQYYLPTGLAIFDTFAKLIAAGGGDEDKAKDQGRLFANLQRVKNETACHVALIGHTGKDESRGSRGSNAFLGDVDVMVTIGGDDIKTATVTKANDAPEGPLFSFKSEVFEFGADEDGDPITVNIVSDEKVSQSATVSREPKLSANQKTLFGMLHAAGASGLMLEDWNLQAKEAGIGVKRKADLNDIRAALLTKGLVREYAGRWTARHDG